jgi:hypothetical protein
MNSLTDARSAWVDARVISVGVSFGAYQMARKWEEYPFAILVSLSMNRGFPMSSSSTSNGHMLRGKRDGKTRKRERGNCGDGRN